MLDEEYVKKNVLKINSKRADYVVKIFWVLITINILSIISSYFEIELLHRIQLNEFVSDNEADMNDLRQGLVGMLQIVVLIATVVLFLNWFRRAYGNLHRAGIKYLNHSEKMAVWSFFIPIIFLYRPFQIMKEIWTETQLKIKKLDPTYQMDNNIFLIGLWWTLYIISNIAGRIAFRLSMNAETVDEMVVASQAYLASDFMDIPAAIAIIYVVIKVSKKETILYQTMDLTENETEKSYL